MEGMEKIKRASRRLGLVFRWAIPLTPGLVALFWYLVGQNNLIERQLPVSLDPGLPPLAKVGGFAVSMLPGAVLMYILYQLGKLFRLYEQGSFFTRANVAIFHRLGWSTVAWVAGDFLHTVGLGIVLTLHRPAGQRLLVVNFTSEQALGVLAGLVLLTISWVMDEARKIEEEQALII
ncbi:MAG: DUF2975 domain-containing protein [Desulfarculus sp.]|nr:DUF2975 domain-containing protein [Desulfarculus sp.]